ncbi:four-carbon acid sugar kinase family protein [Kineococcus sp. SYSU DK006]|uniref:four-carbon acid sugar kinase family protein n=1 Tax=Kineococcus sp. SYSU DK006 TaxID=3383127 RepID=UPI003D7E1C14
MGSGNGHGHGHEGASTAPVLLLADDLSGAAEAALAHGGPSTLLLDPAAPAPGAEVLVVDLDSRSGPAGAAAAGLAAALERHAPGPGGQRRRVALKVDSLLRGHLAAVTAAALATGAPVVLAPALPVAGRTVRGGVVHVDGTPLHRTGAWHAELTAPPVSVAAALAPGSSTAAPAVPAVVLGLDAVRSGEAELTAAIAAAAAQRAVAVCDGSEDSDLDAVVRAATPLGAVLVGSAGVVAALGRSRPAGPAPVLPPRTGERDVLVVVGTAAPGARTQVALLRGAGAVVAGLAEDSDPGAVAAALRSGCGVLTLPPGVVDPARSRPLVSALAETVRAVVAAHPAGVDLVLTGGETARRVLDALGVRSLEPLAQVHHGAVVSRAPDGRLVATRPGSFGGADSLLALARALGALPETTPSSSAPTGTRPPTPSQVRQEIPR